VRDMYVHTPNFVHSPHTRRTQESGRSANMPAWSHFWAATETQIEFRGLHTRRIRVDMGWREWNVAVEYDGIQHWDDPYQRAWDIERIALLEGAGWIVIRVSAAMLSRPDALIERVKAKLRERGAYR